MRKTMLLILMGIIAAGAMGQSGRKGMKPLPPPSVEQLSEPPIESSRERESVESSRERESVAPVGLTVLPASILKRQLKGLDDGSFSLADFSGKILVVNLWASWCGPCRREVPEYEKVRKEFAGRGVEFIGLTGEDPRTSSERVRRFVRDLNFGFRQAWADRETMVALMNGRNSIPQTLIIASNGRVVSHWRGYSAGQNGNHLRDVLEHTLAESPRAGQNTQ